MNNKNQPNTAAKMRVLFADDEPPAREKLSHQLSLMEHVDVVGMATNGKEAISLINELKPDVVLLDIQMPEINGLELIDLLNYQPIIIYTTAYDQFAIEAFENASTDYLLKPFPIARLKKALAKAQQQLEQQRAHCQVNSPEHEQTFALTENTLNKLISKNGERIFLLSPADIKFIKSEQGNSLAWNGDTFHHLSDTLDQLEHALVAKNFVRIHRSYLVNVDHIKEIQRWFNGKLMVIVNDDIKSELSTSRAGADKLKQLLHI
ncbi:MULTISPECIES: LytTR family transcriptional regulator DNA-binding domain-containing protein [unclassified Pseudoalteromonas]|uniref:LytR/AlgR family response regulator transcription factor n=1 Tax=unclassified Pseudoalteromonas TaxID=194690 RepID=UPI00110820D2|nr:MULTISPECIES: LytTR family transcriptional regulator DNA-binding domain-containing protein [unclassified Pseudoalteromonas]TMN84145.1 DNA-binding response regulator [Pseudoalteromonas sp. S410]TMN90613.1 DNA-binding response regulator [Pseudoalteromonas sp. S408]TMN95261.1 DNA-binding response regulator [Pseudoalteromonas sp. S407]TMN97817.1 DNA-binding response regulator [Pseudoalteromonas sp. S409]TMO07682.1 DNA-binding response regulator [Pseudoalteromonas sp. S186]